MNNEIVLLRRIEELEKLIQRQPEIGGVWQDWTPTLAGWSSDPSGIYRYCTIGELCTLSIYQFSAGTSNSTSLTITAPFTIKSGSHAISCTRFRNNGTVSASSGMVLLDNGSNVMYFYTTFSGGAWAASNDKRIIHCMLTYEIA